MLVGQKNAPEIASELASTLDFAVLEECLEQGFCAEFQPYIAAGKPVFQIEYPGSSGSGDVSDADYEKFCGTTEGNEGFSEVLKRASEQVDGWGQYCDGTGFWETLLVDGE
jgi:hypothetical protein